MASKINFSCVNANNSKIGIKNPKNRESYDSVYKILATFETKTPVCTCTGDVKVDNKNMKAVYLGYRVNGKPAIRGSSIKGALNTYALILSDAFTVSDLFGTMGVESRLYFKDAIVDSEYKEYPLGVQWTPRKYCKGIKVYPQNQPPQKQEKILFEAIPQGTTFTAEIIAINVDNKELSLLLACMGCKNYGIKLGRGKDRGYGIIKLKDVEIRNILNNSEKLNIDINGLLNEACKEILGKWNNVGPAFFP
ncbi:hypothetical protein DFR86_11410 [Acidianus sulfidivorans JP7]|uniref:CRISPR type III-associated protein domain-containing protein n=1 Tax=Acidianus sulfidivorans JP7 TaxID=619593 RepID=A0A2U9IPZ8_9CREN|nr:RAMP superfamily CRISPR-associated protein [Acidianus sulfidivorans]AWR98082.1 hypothetical protein DFR86_11410 [Acidianus sulfidivorans JP7]